MFRSPFFQKYLLPGFVFQSVVIAGGYGTGREMIEFFLSLGPVSGLLAMAVTTVIWSLVAACTFEFARRFQAYDYRHFFKELLGRGWVLFEFSYLAIMIIVLAVVTSAAGNVLQELTGWPYNVGVIGLGAYVSFMTFRGTRMIERVLSVWSMALYAVYILLFVFSVHHYHQIIALHLKTAAEHPGWLLNGIKYAGYNLGLIPAVLFSIRHIETRKEALTSGLLTGPIGIIPGILFYVCMLGLYPEITHKTVPSLFLLQQINQHGLLLAFNIVLLGTLIETGTGLIHAVNERIATTYSETQRKMPVWLRPASAILCLGTAVLFAQFGLITLIAKGYVTLTWLLIVVYVLPIILWGAFKLFCAQNSKEGGCL